LHVDGAVSTFAFAVAVGEGRHIVVMPVAVKENAKATAMHNESIVRPKKAKRPIGKVKTAGGTDNINKNEKTWMMPLQHPEGHWL
jgi:hypothetical protein